MRFSDKKVFITGASRGIGASIASKFRDEGAFVIGTRTSSSSEIEADCDYWLDVDFTDEKQILECARYLKTQTIDILINNAGINSNGGFAEIDLDMFKTIQQVNLLAPFLLCQAVIKGMSNQSWGRIVNISSIFGKISKEGRAAYSASKFGLDGLTIALAAEYSSDGIIANCIAPGFIDTSLTRRMLSSDQIKALTAQVPVGRLGDVGEISNLVLWLSSSENTFITGQNIAIDGGFTRV
jgi:NAD(P)-dependent dehydrogenase (short-subunit alcohol dehydrogenase family)